jgi:hypothetical protein
MTLGSILSRPQAHGACVAPAAWQWLSLFLLLLNAGCSIPHLKAPLPPGPGVPRASFDLVEPRGKEDVLLTLALSGGGSRAAYFSTAMMERLQHAFPEVDLLKEVDACHMRFGQRVKS